MADCDEPGAAGVGGVVKAPFPWFGGKSRAAELIWSRLGDVENYVEPFAGSLAVLLDRPHYPFQSTRVETVNDKDCYVANFWRAIQADPEAVAHYADYPVIEADLHARHAWLHRQVETAERLKSDPDFFDVRIAGYWCWGLSSWIGDNFCRPKPQASTPHLGTPGMGINRKLPHLGDPGKGINRKLPHLGTPGKGINRKLPHLGTPGMGINRQLPHLGTPGKGINRQLPHLGDPGMGGCQDRHERLLAYFSQLADRLRGVRVCCGDWQRVLTPSVTFRHGVTGILLDPPYEDHGGDDVYGDLSNGVAPAVWAWAVENGKNPALRIAVCGYDDGRDVPDGWVSGAWRGGGGYANISGKDNRSRERIWFSQACAAQAQEVLPL